MSYCLHCNNSDCQGGHDIRIERDDVEPTPEGEPGWLARQMESVTAQVDSWPRSMQERCGIADICEASAETKLRDAEIAATEAERARIIRILRQEGEEAPVANASRLDRIINCISGMDVL